MNSRVDNSVICFQTFVLITPQFPFENFFIKSTLYWAKSAIWILALPESMEALATAGQI